MTPETGANLFWTSLSLMGLIYLIFWRTRSLAIDWYRDEMFKLRDGLFDAAADGLIDFNHPAYYTLRTLMNGLIRFCHKLSLLHIILRSTIFSDPSDKVEQGEFNTNWNDAIKDLDAPTLKKLREYKIKIQQLIIAYIILSSPFIAIALFIVVLTSFAIESIGSLFYEMVMRWAAGIRKSPWSQTILKELDDVAYATGNL